MERKFDRKISTLEAIFAFVDEFASTNNLDDSVLFLMNFVIEEIFTNMVKYSPTTKSEILVSLDKEAGTLVISLTDFDVEPFDLTKTEEVDIHQSLRERKIGGLGIHLVKKMVDKVDYEYKNRESKIILTKSLEK